MCTCYTTLAVGEESFETTMAVGEEGPEDIVQPCFTTQAVGEECPTTFRVTEEIYTTQAEGEEGPDVSALSGVDDPFGGF